MKRIGRFLCITLAAASALPAQVAGQANSGYKTEEQRKGVANGLADPARDEKQKPGSRLELELFLSGDVSVTVLAEVVWVETLPEGAPARFDVGLRFVDVRPEDLERIAALLGDR